MVVLTFLSSRQHRCEHFEGIVDSAIGSFELGVCSATSVGPELRDGFAEFLQLFGKFFPVVITRAARHAETDDSFATFREQCRLCPDAPEIFRW